MCFSLTITASCPMNLQYFPMDRQLCHIEIESCKYATYTHACTYSIHIRVRLSIYIYVYVYIRWNIYVYTYNRCVPTSKIQFHRVDILAYVTSTRHTDTHIPAHIIYIMIEVGGTFPCTLDYTTSENDNWLSVSFWRQSSTCTRSMKF